MITRKATLLTFTLFLVLTIPFVVQAEDVDPLANFTVSKSEIADSLAKLKASGKISEADYNAAKKELDGMSDSQVGAIKDKAVGLARKNPDKALELINKPKLDAKELEKQLNGVK
jgi:hypothetical protein